MVITLGCNKSCDIRIIKLKSYNNNFILSNLTIALISITLGIDITSHN